MQEYRTGPTGLGPRTTLLAPGSGGLAKDGVALCHQVTTIDRRKLLRWCGALPPDVLAAVKDGLRATLDLL